MSSFRLVTGKSLAWLGLFWLSSHSLAASPLDNTTCSVLTASDSSDDFNSLRRKLEEGFNRDTQRFCTEKINFQAGKEFSVRLAKTLEIANLNDLDCPAGDGKPAVCGDGWGLVVDGTSSSSVTLDASDIPEGTCALRIAANRVQLNGFAIIVKRREDAICNEGANNDFSGVEIIADQPLSPTPSPSPSPTPPVSPTPSASPTPTPKATASPTPSPSASPTPSAAPTATPSPSPTPTPTSEPDDEDGDGILDSNDNCRIIANPEQADADGDAIGDACDDDFAVSPGDDDGDGNGNESDNCANVANANQADSDQDGLGDACDTQISVNIPDPFPGFSESTKSAGCGLGDGLSISPAAPWSIFYFLPALLGFFGWRKRK